jgi:branched-chain amino acid transport system substrate-binding protein
MIFRPSAIRALLVAFALLACCTPAFAAQPYELPILVPMTGYAAFFGTSQTAALLAIQDYVNDTGGIQGRPLKFVIKDDQTNPQVDVELLNQLLPTKPGVVLGPNSSGQCNAIEPLTRANGPVMYCFTPGIRPKPGGYVFATGAEAKFAFGVMMNYFVNHGLKRIAWITATDANGQDASRILDSNIGNYPSLIAVDKQTVGITDVSASAQIASIKASGAQALIVYVTGTPFGTVLRAIKDTGLEIPIMASGANLIYSELDQYKSLMPDDILFPSHTFLVPELSVSDKAVSEQLRIMTRYLKKHDARPDQGSNSVWDGVMLTISGLRKLGGNVTPEKLRAYISSLTNWPGTNGRYNFKAYPQRGIGRNTIAIIRYNPAKQTFRAVTRGGGLPLVK